MFQHIGKNSDVMRGMHTGGEQVGLMILSIRLDLLSVPPVHSSARSGFLAFDHDENSQGISL